MHDENRKKSSPVEVETTAEYVDFTDGTEIHIAKGCKYVKG